MLAEQNRALQMAQKNTVMAGNSFQRAMSSGMRKPMQEEGLSSEQQLTTDTMMKTSNVLSVLVNDVMDDDFGKESGSFPSELKTFRLHSLVREEGCLAWCLSVASGYGFTIEADRSLPNHVVGDERRVQEAYLRLGYGVY